MERVIGQTLDADVIKSARQPIFADRAEFESRLRGVLAL